MKLKRVIKRIVWIAIILCILYLVVGVFLFWLSDSDYTQHKLMVERQQELEECIANFNCTSGKLENIEGRMYCPSFNKNASDFEMEIEAHNYVENICKFRAPQEDPRFGPPGFIERIYLFVFK